MSEDLSCIAVLPPGMERLGVEELGALGAESIRPLRRAVAFHCDPAVLYRSHLQARLPYRILRELARFPCGNRQDLYDGVWNAADWDLWLPPERSFRVDASGTIPGLNHSHYSALQVKNALVDRQRQHWGRRSTVDLDDPDLSLHLHLGGGEAVLSVDGSGGSLHRRGYRPAMGLAPLKENLAAGLIALTDWDGTQPLVDPLCGSGTLLIEAVCWALGRAPGLHGDQPRSFALRKWSDFDEPLWLQEMTAALALRRSVCVDGQPLAPVVGMEKDPQVLEQARANAASAGVAPWISFRAGDARDLQPPGEGEGMLVCNPPYGVRLGDPRDLEVLYADLGEMAKRRCPGWTLWILSGNPELTGALRMKATRRIPVSNGGIDCRWLRYEIRKRSADQASEMF